MDNLEYYAAGREGSSADTDQMTLKVLDLSDLMPIQSISLAVQDVVDTLKNRATINTTAVGSAYAKWLANPAMGTDYQQLIETATTEPPTSKLTQLTETLELLHKLKDAQHYSGSDHSG
ncbi:hypothetical protein FKG94_14245 [Exilibacterium tricleocarpae]|uniref:Uncharacterized protein n=1 Tax=Exilibacterium tricleocarpae TaxID=2591008 RepID=A0A545TLV4_9GAMM|nr:hypothetical protein [Exilibacterium tricleocarpae]TQV78225.1 hypothetical protein FKG94_14245 [Exilibacterium tricleocarpae]